MLHRLLAVFFFLSACLPASASHLMGGEITWQCQPNGQFVFQMKIYRDCNGITFSPTGVSLAVHNHPTITSIPMTLFSQTDISPRCNGAFPNITCTGGGQGAVQEFVLRSNPITLSGIPPLQGWAFTYDNCCRNAAITNLSNPGSLGFTLRAIMYSYQNQNMNPCYDSSPVFAESPSTVICTGYPFTYNHNAYDPDLDSLTYSWAEALDDMNPGPFSPTNPPVITYSGGYSFTSPLPGPIQNASNVASVVHPNTGEISFTSFTPGNFVTVIKVGSYKCGFLVAEVFREMQVVLLSCGSNTPPNVTPPFQDPLTLLYTRYADTVLAGTLVTFTLSATDFEFLPNGFPQSLSITASGSQFGTNYTNTASGCLNPPCAVLNPPPTVPPTLVPFGIATEFNWQTTCDHVTYMNQCNVFSNTYTFVIKTADDFCPAPAINIATISITVLPLAVIEEPKIKCVSVLPSGDVALTWEIPPDPEGTFNSYHIYYSNTPFGPFVPLDSIFVYGQNSYTHVGASANLFSMYYYMQTRSGCYGEVFSANTDTVRTMDLTVTSFPGQANLNWIPFATPLPFTTTGWFKIYREFPIGTWILLDSTQNTFYSEIISVCNDSLSYRVELMDSSGCISVSTIDGGRFQDLTAPYSPKIDSVSVDPLTGVISIGWNVNPLTDTECYIIYHMQNGIWSAIDTVCGLTNTFYNTGLIAANVDSFRLQAYDTCGNISPLGVFHSSMILNVVLDKCQRRSILSWNSYANWQAAIEGYNIFVSENGTPFSLLATVPGNVISYPHTNLTQFSTYCYYIQAEETGSSRTASSTSACIFADVPKAPVFLYMRNATVISPTEIEINFYGDTAADVIRYRVLRSVSRDTSLYEEVGTVASTGSPFLKYLDSGLKTGLSSYFYKAIAVDSCGNDIYTSDNHARSIMLTGDINDELHNLLYWSDYEEWYGSGHSYDVYRSADDKWISGPVKSTSFLENTYNDDISVHIENNGKFCYYVEAVEAGFNIYNLKDTARSNVICLVQSPRIFIPNAFMPGGKNPLFRPVSVFDNPSHYEFFIYNRWGEMIFKTNDPYEGWNGTNKGSDSPEGAYAYIVKFFATNGMPIERKGLVSLIR